MVVIRYLWTGVCPCCLNPNRESVGTKLDKPISAELEVVSGFFWFRQNFQISAILGVKWHFGRSCQKGFSRYIYVYRSTVYNMLLFAVMYHTYDVWYWYHMYVRQLHLLCSLSFWTGSAFGKYSGGRSMCMSNLMVLKHKTLQVHVT